MPVLEELVKFIDSILKNHNIWTMLQNPVCSSTEKQQLIGNCLQKAAVSEPLGRFFRVIIQKKRLALLPAFKKNTQIKIQKIQNIAEATISVATELNESSEALIPRPRR